MNCDRWSYSGGLFLFFFKRVCLNFIARKGFHVFIWFLHEFFFFQKPSFARRRWCDRRLNNNIYYFQQNYFSETFFSRGADGLTDRLNNKNIFQKPFFSRGAGKKLLSSDVTCGIHNAQWQLILILKKCSFSAEYLGGVEKGLQVAKHGISAFAVLVPPRFWSCQRSTWLPS